MSNIPLRVLPEKIRKLLRIENLNSVQISQQMNKVVEEYNQYEEIENEVMKALRNSKYSGVEMTLTKVDRMQDEIIEKILHRVKKIGTDNEESLELLKKEKVGVSLLVEENVETISNSLLVVFDIDTSSEYARYEKMEDAALKELLSWAHEENAVDIYTALKYIDSIQDALVSQLIMLAFRVQRENRSANKILERFDIQGYKPVVVKIKKQPGQKLPLTV